MKNTMISFDIYKSSVSERQNALRISQAIISLEHGYMSDESLINYNYWLAGEWQLNQVRFTEFEKFSQAKVSTANIILENRLNISSERVLNLACSSIVCSRLLELSTIAPAFENTITHLCKVHKALYNDIYPYAGTIQTSNISAAEPLLGFHELVFIQSQSSEEDYIHHLSNLLQSLEMDTAELKSRCICDKLAYFCSAFYYCHPFLYGNILLIIYALTKWSEQNNFDFPVSNIIKYNDDHNLQRCIALGAYTLSNKKNLSEDVFNGNLSLLSDLLYKIHGGKDEEDAEIDLSNIKNEK